MLPKELNFESMAQAFMNLVGERYPTSEKVLSLAKNLGVENNIRGQIIVFSQFRDAVREVSRDQIYRSVQHRDEVLAAIIEALEKVAYNKSKAADLLNIDRKTLYNKLKLYNILYFKLSFY